MLAFVFSGRILLLIATTEQLLARAAPTWSSKEFLDTPDSYQDYLTSQDPALADDKRAPWAPSMPRANTYSQKIRELFDRNKGLMGKRSKQSEQVIELGQLSDEDIKNLLRFLQTRIQGLDNEAIDFAMMGLSGRGPSSAQQNYIGKSANKRTFIYQLDGSDEELKQQPKRSAFNLGLGQHAASAAMSAYENILDEGKNFKSDRPSSPVRFLGKRKFLGKR